MALSNQAPAVGDWGNFIPPRSPWLSWSGRVDFHDQVARFDWSQVTVRCAFDGSACAIYLDPVDNNFNVFVDGHLAGILGKPPKDSSLENYPLWLKPQKNKVRIWVLQGLGKGKHLLEVNKRTGANFNVARFYGIRLDASAKLRRSAHDFPHRIEFIGDSLTNAYGCEASKRDCSELRPFENGWKSYAALTARSLDADMQVLALSGFGVVRNYGDEKPASSKPMPVHYGRVISGQEELLWNRSKFKPDAVVVNLGTNDFSTEPVPDATSFVKGYMDLLAQALKGRGKIPVFIVSVKGRQIQERRLADVVGAAKAKGIDAHMVEFGAPGDDELGCDWHPQAVVHERWAKTLTKAIKTTLAW